MKETLIGKTARIISSRNKCLEGIEGKVIDETKNTIRIITKDSKEKTIIKSQATLEINGRVVKGREITKRVEERIKK